MSQEKIYQTIIIGGGPAGLSAAIYAARAHLEPAVLLGVGQSSQLQSTTNVENYPGIETILGPDLIEAMRAQAEKSGAATIYDDVTSLGWDSSTRVFYLVTGMHSVMRTKTVIYATGSKPRVLHVPGHDTFWNHGVSTCAVCDSRFATGRPVVVVGGGDVACEEALYASHLATIVYLVLRRDVFRASAAMQERVRSCPNIEIIVNSSVKEIQGDEKAKRVERVVVIDKMDLERVLAANALFWCIGHEPHTQLVRDLCTLRDSGHILTYQGTMTSHPGLFAAGDCADWVYRQAVVAAGAGCMAALDAGRWLDEQNQK